MARVRSNGSWPQGRILSLPHCSKVLEGNPWDDPVDRDLNVYLPPAYDESGPPLVGLWDLAAFTNSGPGHLNWAHRGENLPRRLDRLIGEGALPPVVVFLPDCFTSLGGNQYVNSPAVGRYADYLVDELVPLASERVNVIDRADSRGLFGKSSGGYGALMLAMRYPDIWGGLAAHSGDVGFEWVYRPGFATACRVLAGYCGDVEAFLRAFWSRRSVGGDDYTTLLTVAMAATYDADPAAPRRIRLPFDLRTCRLLPERWEHWLEHDPLYVVEEHADALRNLELLYLDVGNRDEYHIQFGTRALCDRLEELDIDHHFEEFEGTHRNLDWRLDHSLPRLAGALGA